MQRRKLRARSGRRRSRRRSCASSRVVRLDRSNAPRSTAAVSALVLFFAASSGGVAFGSGASRTSHPPSSAYFRKSSRTRSAAASLSLTLGERKSANAHLSLASSFSAVSTPANGAGCRVKSANALSRSLSHESTAAPSSEVVHSSRRHGAYGDASSASARAERLSSGFGLVSDGVSEGSHVSATALRRSSAAYFLSYGDPGYVDAKSARTSHLVHAAHRSPLSSAASASSDDAARAPRPVAPYRPRPSSGSDPGWSRAAARLRASARANVAARWHPFLIRDRSLRSMDESPFRNAGESPRRHTGIALRSNASSRSPGRLARRPSRHANSNASIRVRASLHTTARSRRLRGTSYGADEPDADPEPAAAETATETRAMQSGSRSAAARAARSTETKAALRRAPNAAAEEDESERSKPTTLSRASSVLRRFAAFLAPSFASFSSSFASSSPSSPRTSPSRSATMDAPSCLTSAGRA